MRSQIDTKLTALSVRSAAKALPIFVAIDNEFLFGYIPVSEHEGIHRALALLLVALQAEVEHPSLPEETPEVPTRRAVEGADRCACD
jgi:hypothetical protein